MLLHGRKKKSCLFTFNAPFAIGFPELDNPSLAIPRKLAQKEDRELATSRAATGIMDENNEEEKRELISGRRPQDKIIVCLS